MTHTQRIPVPQLKADAPANQLCKITQLIPALAGTAGFGTQRGPLVRWQAGARGPPPVPFRETEGGPLAGAIPAHAPHPHWIFWANRHPIFRYSKFTSRAGKGNLGNGLVF